MARGCGFRRSSRNGRLSRKCPPRYDSNGALKADAVSEAVGEARPKKVALAGGSAEVNAALYAEDDVDLEDLEDG